LKVVSLHLYPIKGTRAHDVERASLHQRGFEGDRRWLVVDPNGTFQTQRSLPQLAQIVARPSHSGITLSAVGQADLAVDYPDASARQKIWIWDAEVDAALAGPAAHDWLSRFLGQDFRLVHMDAQAERLKRSVWTPDPLPVSFADAYPVLVTTTGSLAALNAEIERKGGTPVTMRRFRPNIVLDCDEPWAEDFWHTLKIGKTEIELVKPCDRCVVTTKDQITGVTTGEEPLTSLRRLRMSADPRVKGVLFGWNAAPRVLGDIAVGDEVEIRSTRSAGFPIHKAA
jgi:uncharacterized protein YcbX